MATQSPARAYPGANQASQVDIPDLSSTTAAALDTLGAGPEKGAQDPTSGTSMQDNISSARGHSTLEDRPSMGPVDPEQALKVSPSDGSHQTLSPGASTGGEQNSMVGSCGKGQFILTDIVIELTTDTLSGGSKALNIADISLLGVGGTRENQCNTLLLNTTPGSTRRWAMGGSIVLPPGVGAMYCTARDVEGLDIGFAFLKDEDLCTTGENARELETIDRRAVGLAMRWTINMLQGAVAQDEARLSELANTMDRIGALKDPEAIKSVLKNAVVQFETTHGTRTAYSNIGLFWHRLFEKTGDIEAINQAIDGQKKVVELTAQEHPDLPRMLCDLGNSYTSRFRRNGDLVDAAQAISLHRRAIQLTPDGDSDLIRRLSCLGRSLQNRVDHTDSLDDVAEAISVKRRAIQLIPEGGALLPSLLTNLGNSLHWRFLRTGNLADISAAISAQQRSVSLSPDGDSSLSRRLSNLGNSFQSRFVRTGDPADLEEAISAKQLAVKRSPEGHPNLPNWLNNLGNSLHTRFEHSGDLADISDAISVKQRAVQLAPQGHPHLPGWLCNLGSAFQARFARMGDLADIREAISAKQRAIELTPEGHVHLPAWLNSVGVSFHSLFGRTGDLADLAAAIESHHQAIQLAPEGHARLPAWFMRLGDALHARFSITGDLTDIADAISHKRRAVELTPEGHADLPGRLNTLGVSLRSRFNRAGGQADITEAISIQQRSVQLCTESNASLPWMLLNLGNSLYDLSITTSSTTHLDASIKSLQSAATSTFGSPQDRLTASRRWAQVLNLHKPLSLDILVAFDTALQLLTLLAGLEQTVKGRYMQLQDAAGVALDGAAAACRLSRPGKAVEWLEQGRCLVWGQLNSLRTPLDDLQAHDGQLAQRLTDVSTKLQSASSTRNALNPSMDIAAKISVEHEARSHLDLAREWEDLLATVRSIPGFESFLQPSPCSTLLQHLPDSGAVVILNVTEDRCDALALSVTFEQPLHIPLPAFSLRKANEYRRSLRTQLQSRGIRMREGNADMDDESVERGLKRWTKPTADTLVVRNILRRLWVEVAKPILDALGYSRYDASSDVALPRIWWCPTGAMSFLPIHAAGIYTNDESESILDYVISSYTPTITALTDRVKNHRPIDNTVSGLFLTSQPNAPGAYPIPGTTKEVEGVHREVVNSRIKVLKRVGSDVDAQACLGFMEEFSSVHLACHASQNAADPLQSRFLLQTGEITLGTIIQMNLKNADLAFLSACQTSTGEEKLSDEAVHLAAGMLAAGYRRVVATMWSIKDQHAPDIAREFYEYLCSHREDGGDVDAFDASLSAHALHHAVLRLRQRIGNSEDSLLTWIPYVHFGY